MPNLSNSNKLWKAYKIANPLNYHKALQNLKAIYVNLEDYVIDFPINLTLPMAFEPKRNNRWMITLPELFDISSYHIFSTSRPSIVIGETISYSPIWIKMYDPIGPSTTRKLWDIYIGISNTLDETVIEESQFIELQNRFELVKNNGFTYSLELLDPTGVVIEKWLITGKIIEFDFGDLDCNNDDVVKCGFKIQPTKIALVY